jgi:hypothetical protein
MKFQNSPVHTLTVPGKNIHPNEYIVYMSNKHLKKGEFVFKPISLDNEKSLFNEGKIKNSKRLATIQYCVDGIYLSWNRKFDTDVAFELEIKLDNGQYHTIGPVHNFVQLTDGIYQEIEAVYTKYLDDKLAALTAEQAQRENNRNPNVGGQKAAKKDDAKCVIC